jgi:DNA-binding XRE family transcriptional regulator
MDITEMAEGRKGQYRKRKKWRCESLALVVDAKSGLVDDKDILDPFVWRARPGGVFADFMFGPGRQTALLSQRALEYDPYRQKWEKRLTRYLSYQWRICQKNCSYLHPYFVETILKAIGEEVDKNNPLRTKERLEEALNQLLKDGIIVDWRYVSISEEIIGKPGWVEHWLKWQLVMEPPQDIIEQYAKIKNPEKKPKALPSTSATSATVELGARLKKKRLELDLTQMQAADQIGINHSRISRIEKGDKPSPENLAKIEKWLADER